MLAIVGTIIQIKLPWFYVLFAAAAKRGTISAGTVGLVLAIVLAISLAVALYWLVRNQQPTQESLSRSLFRELCRVHQLSGNQSKLVWRLAKLLKLACPSVLFVDSSAWRIPEGDLDKKDWNKLQKIQKTLFQPPSLP